MRLQLILLLLTTSNAISSAVASDVGTGIDSTTLNFAQVTHVQATQKSDGSWCFDTSVRHNDQSWAHYADGWEVVDLEGNQLGYRHLAHPHDNEQPFTRSQCGIQIPPEVSTVIVRAKCNQHGYGGKSFTVELHE